MVNNDVINNIRRNIKMSFNKKIFDFFMNKYLSQDMNTYSSNEGEKIFDFIRLNSENSSPLNQNDYKELIMILINRSITEAQKNGVQITTNELTAKLLTGLKKREGRLTFDSEDLFGNKIDGDKNIFFYIDIDGENIVGMVKDIISQMDEKGIAYDITIPNADEMLKGHTDAIIIAASPESFMSTVEALENISQDKKDKVKDNDYAKDNWYGINTVVNNVPADVLIGKLFIQGMNEIIKEEAVNYSYVDIEGKSISEFIESETNKDKIRKLAYESLMKIDNSISDKVFNRVLELIDSKGLNINNMYMYDIINDELDKQYGKIDAFKEEIVVEDSKEEVELKDTITELTLEEKQSMTKAIDETQETLERENKYLGLLDGVEGWKFDSLVIDETGNDITLLDFLDKNNTLDKVPFNAVVTLLDTTTADGVSVSGKKFIAKYVLDNLKLIQANPDSQKGLTLEEIMEKYVEKVEVPEVGVIYPEGLTSPNKKKESFLAKILKGR